MELEQLDLGLEVVNITKFERDIADYAMENFNGPSLTIRICEEVIPPRDESGLYSHVYSARFLKPNILKSRRFNPFVEFGESYEHVENLKWNGLESPPILRNVRRYILHKHCSRLAELNAQIVGPSTDTTSMSSLFLFNRLPRSSSIPRRQPST